MKKLLLIACAVFAFSAAQSQDQGKIRVSWDLGAAIPGNGVGVLTNLEGNYNISDNMRAGLRFGFGTFVRALDIDGSGEFESGDFSANLSYLGTFDYAFNNGSSFAPYVGGGLGVFRVGSVAGVAGEDFVAENVEESVKFGAVLRGGFEVGKFRMGLEYNFIPSTDLQNAAGATVGTMSNSYFGVSLGFFVGGGWWGR